VRRADGEPTSRGRVGGRLLVPLVVAAAAVVVLSTAAGGRPVFTSPFGSGRADGPPATPPPAPTVLATPQVANPLVPTVSSVVQTVLTVLVCIVALAVAALLIRLLVSAILERRRRTRLHGRHGLEAGAEPEVADAPTVLRGIAAALGALDEHREPGDAVVRAWLGLQQAAEDAGFARSPAETPTEFTGRVLSRTGADRAALRTLLRLYLRARFADGAISSADATAAREALHALAASWERVTA
jgi:hypothetical protein